MFYLLNYTVQVQEIPESAWRGMCRSPSRIDTETPRSCEAAAQPISIIKNVQHACASLTNHRLGRMITEILLVGGKQTQRRRNI